MFGLDPWMTFVLIFCIFTACVFEFINGFHDTANAVATVIYTHTLKPQVAVIWSGMWNFFGVIRGGIDVAMGIVLLLPLEALISGDPMLSVAMVLALLIAAILWNLGTWYFGIPCSSSHTLIGSIIGVGLAFQFMPQNTSGALVNWSKASDIGLSLLVSPLIGLGLTIVVMLFLRAVVKNKKIFTEPEPDKKPPLWIRTILIGTCTAVSFAHGNNDGQKGVGLIMVILIALTPFHFALDHSQDIRKIAIDLQDLKVIIAQIDKSTLSEKTSIKMDEISEDILKASIITESVDNIENLTKEDQLALRNSLIHTSKNLGKLIKQNELPLTKETEIDLKRNLKDTQAMTDYAPMWVIMLISISLGLGTMIGWKRIVVTIGEKIGKSHLTYAQGASAELVAATTIFGASKLGLPVSTTQVLTSAIAGSMISKEGFKNLQPSTLKSIGLAWVLTFPVCVTLAGGLFWIFTKIML